jgi:hypothetical protein
MAGRFHQWPFLQVSGAPLARAKTEVSEEAEVRQLLLGPAGGLTAFPDQGDLRGGLPPKFTYAQESMRMAKERYEAGAGTVTDLLDSQTALARAQANQVEAEWDYHTAQALFKRSIGSLEEKNRPLIDWFLKGLADHSSPQTLFEMVPLVKRLLIRRSVKGENHGK